MGAWNYTETTIGMRRFEKLRTSGHRTSAPLPTMSQSFMMLLRQKFLHGKRDSRHRITQLAVFRNQQGHSGFAPLAAMSAARPDNS